ncbi:Rne/Rng family ribonuclease [Methylocella sp.]|uniref:Rne/Rng family ribonuclease n=1 Tax=Methylocella sp. TaxID=1978226 RepID=UPI0037850F57
MANKMLIDASHPEETRVVVTRGSRVEEFDFESASKKQLRGNIYLAKVTRVEPSLQAAFVDYGGNRHGFLAFSEIHPDYYQIPMSDRQALLEDEAREQVEADEEESGGQRRSRRNRRDRNGRRAEKRMGGDGETVSEPFEGAPEPAEAVGSEGEPPQGEAPDEADAERSDGSRPLAWGDGDVEFLDVARDGETPSDDAAPRDESGEAPQALPPVYGEEPQDFVAGADAAAAEYLRAHPVEEAPAQEEPREPEPRDEAPAGEDEGAAFAPPAVEAEPEARSAPGPDEDAEAEDEEEHVEQLGGDAMEEVPYRQPRYRRQYKIQEVIKRRQVLLVQVVKEERGNKGAALTTYLSLAGRYSVLMPNTARGGGISRKITDAGDRQRLKSIAQDLEVPEGMGVILRTAGASRTKQEVKRDFEYLLRMWETVRETTLKSSAPTLVYEEGSLIKRAIRDLYNKDIDDILVAGERGYREARDFMRLLMPSHVNSVQPYRDPQPIFSKSDVESQLDALFVNQVTLKSGGYLVINQTEALVAIDVNSGRSTREHNIEDTALRTNLEAADEVARQLRLRDLAGLIVVDFIDMEESRNNRSVERRLKDALKNDRARIQIGRISHFGLLEMSRQRIRTGVLEGSTEVCPHCAGSGILRSTASIALHVLRVVEETLVKNAGNDLVVRTRAPVALYILNEKRANLRDLERRFGVCVNIEVDDSLIGSVYHAIERSAPASGGHEPIEAAAPEPVAHLTYEGADDALDETEDDEALGAGESEDGGDAASRADGDTEEGRRRRRRRRRRGRGGDRDSSGVAANAPQPPDDALGAIAEIDGQSTVQTAALAADDVVDASPEEASSETVAAEEAALIEAEATAEAPAPASTAPLEVEAEAEAAEPAPAKPRRTRRARTRETAAGSAETAEAPESEEEDAPAPARRARRAPRARTPKRAAAEAASEAEEANVPQPQAAETAASAPAAEAAEASPPEAAAAEDPPAEAPAQEYASASDGAPESPASVEPAPARSVPLPEAEPDPNRPKRTGWWQRAKATLGH